jgi:hypothetical protein
MPFDPDKFLAETSTFDPDKFLAETDTPKEKPITYSEAAAPRQSALPQDAGFVQKRAAEAGDAASFVGRAISASPVFVGALQGSGGNVEYAIEEFYKDLAKTEGTGFIDTALRDPATVWTLPLGGVGGKMASKISSSVIKNIFGRIAAKTGARAAGGAVESVPSAIAHQVENVAEGKDVNAKQGAAELALGGGMSGAMGTGAQILSKTAKTTALKTISAFLRPGQKGAKEGFDPENIFKHNLQAGSIDGMFEKTLRKTNELKAAREAIKAQASNNVTLDATNAFSDAITDLKPTSTKNIYDQDAIEKTLDDIKDLWSKKYPNAAYMPLDVAMDLKAATGVKAAELGGFDKSGDKTSAAQAKVYEAVTRKLNVYINDTIEKNGLGNLKEINKQYEEVLPVLYAIVRRKPILKSNLPISLQDVAEGGVGAATASAEAGGWDKALRAIAVMAAGKVAANPLTSKALYNASKGGVVTKATGPGIRQAARSNLFSNFESE